MEQHGVMLTHQQWTLGGVEGGGKKVGTWRIACFLH